MRTNRRGNTCGRRKSEAIYARQPHHIFAKLLGIVGVTFVKPQLDAATEPSILNYPSRDQQRSGYFAILVPSRSSKEVCIADFTIPGQHVRPCEEVVDHNLLLNLRGLPRLVEEALINAKPRKFGHYIPCLMAGTALMAGPAKPKRCSSATRLSDALI